MCPDAARVRLETSPLTQSKGKRCSSNRRAWRLSSLTVRMLERISVAKSAGNYGEKGRADGTSSTSRGIRARDEKILQNSPAEPDEYVQLIEI